jgi:hypothetical protein
MQSESIADSPADRKGESEGDKLSNRVSNDARTNSPVLGTATPRTQATMIKESSKSHLFTTCKRETQRSTTKAVLKAIIHNETARTAGPRFSPEPAGDELSVAAVVLAADMVVGARRAGAGSLGSSNHVGCSDGVRHAGGRSHGRYSHRQCARGSGEERRGPVELDGGEENTDGKQDEVD